MSERKSQTTERRDGLHCVYGQCRGFPNSNMECNPGCSFTMSAQPAAYLTQIDYSVELQQIIEAICRGRPIPHTHLHHGRMAAEYVAQQGACKQ